MRIGYVFHPDRGATDRMLAATARRLIAGGLRVVGAVQSNSGCAETTPRCDMDLAVLPDGPVFRISQSLGALSRGCRLDTDALEQAVLECAHRLGDAQVLIINKFGKHESEGRGFRSLIADGLERGIPVVIGINRQNRAAFFDFAGDLAERLPGDAGLIAAWCHDAQLKITV